MGRTCKKCGSSKSLEDFKKDKSVKSGHALTCKVCWNKDSNLYKKRHRQLDGVRKKECEYSKSYRLKNLKYVKQKRKDFYAKNKEAELRVGNNWKKNHREEIATKLKKQVDELSDGYILAVVNHNYGLRASTVKRQPEFIENYRQQIKTKRLLKSKKNESTKTS